MVRLLAVVPLIVHTAARQRRRNPGSSLRLRAEALSPVRGSD
jgi:hypothetical protein